MQGSRRYGREPSGWVVDFKNGGAHPETVGPHRVTHRVDLLRSCTRGLDGGATVPESLVEEFPSKLSGHRFGWTKGRRSRRQESRQLDLVIEQYESGMIPEEMVRALRHLGAGRRPRLPSPAPPAPRNKGRVLSESKSGGSRGYAGENRDQAPPNPRAARNAAVPEEGAGTCSDWPVTPTSSTGTSSASHAAGCRVSTSDTRTGCIARKHARSRWF